MNAYEAARAAEILGLEALPAALTIEEIAILQVEWRSLDEKERSTWCKAMRAAIDAGELRQTDGKITAAEFKRWMHEYGGFPSMLIEGWFALHARERKSPGGEKWTPERKDELRAYRDEHGTKAAARQFGISEARVRQLLPTEKPPATWLMPEKRTMRKRKT
jgi:hypothetical protein